MRPLRIALFLCGLLLSAPLLSIVQAQNEPLMDREAAMAMLGELNAWRIAEGLMPVRIDTTLEALADEQARYLLTLRSIPDGAAIHRGRSGEGPRDRARFHQFNWPSYAHRDQIVIGEIAALNTPDRALTFWRGSPPHRDTVMNPVYREVGIVAYRRGIGHLFIVVFGARPNVLPAMYDTDAHQLYLPSESSAYAKSSDIIRKVTEYRLFAADGRPLADWQPWQPKVDVPPTVGDTLFVLYTDGRVETMSEVELKRDVVVLPGSRPVFNAIDGSLMRVTPTPIPPPPTPLPPRPELTLIYDARSLTIINTGYSDLNLGRVALVSETMRLPFSWWSQVIQIPVYQFPPGDCVQAWTVDQTFQPARPRGCNMVRSARSNLRADQQFWTRGPFEVHDGGAVVATCQPDAGICEVELE